MLTGLSQGKAPRATGDGLAVERDKFKKAGMNGDPFDTAGGHHKVAPTALAAGVPIYIVLNFDLAIRDEVVT
jgi:hypothetical protein